MSGKWGWGITILLAGAIGCGDQAPANRAPNLKRALDIREVVDAGPTAAAAGPALVEPTGWATLTGRFKLNGTPTAAEPLKITQDHAVCAPGGKPVIVDEVKVGPDGGLANVLLFLSTPTPADDPKWEHPDYAATKDALLERPFDQKECLFIDRIFALRSTQSVSVKNSDPVGHNANIAPRRGAKPENFTIPGGQAVVYKPGGESPDPFPVTCSIHPWMKSWMISRNSPYFAVTKEDGTFEIKNLPAAEGLKLEFRVWHERSGFVQDVTVNGEKVTWKKGRFDLELAPGEDLALEVEIDASVLQ